MIAGSPEAAAVAMASTLLIPFALVGLALINVGMVRSRNAAHIMMSSLCVIGIAAVAYFVCGFSWQGVTGAPGFALHLGGKPWDWIASLPWFWRGLDWGGSPAALVIFMQIFSVALARPAMSVKHSQTPRSSDVPGMENWALASGRKTK